MSYARNKLTPNQENILKIYQLATPDMKVAGALWYPQANEFAAQLSENYHTDFIKVCAVISALSPQQPWEWNKRDAERVISMSEKMGPQNINPHTDLAGMMASAVGRMKALDILGTWNLAEIPEFFDKTHKTRNFFHNILNPEDERYLTIDTHASNVWWGSKLGPKPLQQIFKNTAHMYEKIVNDYRDVARYLNIKPIVLQATTWLTWKDVVL